MLTKNISLKSFLRKGGEKKLKKDLSQYLLKKTSYLIQCQKTIKILSIPRNLKKYVAKKILE